MLIFGCVGPEETPQETPAPETGQSGAAGNDTGAVVSPPSEEPEFESVHLAYLISVPLDLSGATQQLNYDYYLTEKTECSGRPALNGFVKIIDPVYPDRAAYSKITVYLDSGEAVYSAMASESELAFDGAQPVIPDFDAAFWVQTIVARGGKSMASSEVFESTKPVLLKDVAAFGGNGDYSIVSGKTTSMSGHECKNITISAKTSNMEGQIITCVGIMEDTNLTYMVNADIPDSSGLRWALSTIDDKELTLAFYSQCLSPIQCKKVSRPTTEDYEKCRLDDKSIETTKDEKGCVTAYECLSNSERARRSMEKNQREGCVVNEALVTENADCWDAQGSVQYVYNDQSGCVTSILCNRPS